MNKKIKTLMQRAYENLDSARLLMEKGYNAPSISRAYYGMFYAAEALLLTKRLKFSSHRGVISLFGEHFVKTGAFPKKQGRRLSKVYEKRLNGDYGFDLIFTEEDAREVIEWANDFINSIKNYLMREGLVEE